MTFPNSPTPLVDDYIRARNYTPGRDSPIRLIVFHTAETACAAGVARNVARWFASSAAPQASAHYIVGPDEVIGCVDNEDTAWHAPPVNPYAIGIEHAARASFTAEQWAAEDVQAMLGRSAALVADLCERLDVPVVLLGVDELVAGAAGITTHAAVSKAWHRSDHYDPGEAWPAEAWLQMVREAGAVRVSQVGG